MPISGLAHDSRAFDSASNSFLHAHNRPRCLIDFPWQETRLKLAFGSPARLLQTDRLHEVCALIAEAEHLAQQGHWLVGYVAYDAAPAFDRALRVRTGPAPAEAPAFPLLWFAVFDEPPTDWPTIDERQLASVEASPDWSAGLTAAQHALDVMDLRQRIAAGEAYQINHTMPLEGRLAGDTLLHFLRLHRHQPQAYAAWLELDRVATTTAQSPRSLLSFSPELFFSRQGAGITTRPMKGTAPRGRWSQEDRQQAENLHNCPKNRAENLMIVDLLRNDLSRIARLHSVTADDLFAVEQHPSLWQMTSTIRAQARDHVTLTDLFRALFPCGSVTGAPKAKAMELITLKETSARGLYCGAIGLLRPGGDAIFNVAIRTLTVHDAQARCGVGGAITWDSNAAAEYAEALLKGRFLRPIDLNQQTLAVLGQETLFETLRLEKGSYIGLDVHLARLAASAEYFGIPANTHHWRQQLDALAQEHRDAGYRVRLDIDARGKTQLLIAALPPTPATTSFSLARLQLPADSFWLHHKTSRRSHLEKPLHAAQQQDPGIFDVLLVNERDELTEFTRGNLLLEIDGKLYTPPLTCGLLGGVARAEWLAQGQVQERVLHQADLARASRILFLNSLRGLIEMTAGCELHRTLAKKPCAQP